MKLIGNEATWKQLYIALNSAIKQNRALPHVLLTGAAGCGKTSTARQIAKLTGFKFIASACDSLKTRKDLISLVKNFDVTGYNKKLEKVGRIKPTIVFIDEVHGLSLKAQEILGIIMEERYIPVHANELRRNIRGKNKLLKVTCPEFTLIGATTDDGKLSKPFRDRFKLRFIFTTYTLNQSIEIVKEHANKLQIKIEDDASVEIARRGRGTPRIIVSLLERCRDFVIATNQEKITKEAALIVFDLANINSDGLTKTDLTLMKILADVNGPVGLDNLATMLHESPKVLVEVVEPYLIRKEFIIRSSRGREITATGKKYLSEIGMLEESKQVEENEDHLFFNL